MAINLKSEADKAGKHPSRRFGQRERKLLESVAAEFPFSVVKAGKAVLSPGSATATITDPAIAASDIVIVQVQSSTSSAYVVKTVPGAGSAEVTLSSSQADATLQYIVVRAIA